MPVPHIGRSPYAVSVPANHNTHASTVHGPSRAPYVMSVPDIAEHTRRELDLGGCSLRAVRS
eukprot:2233084-Rhodomonas_salina.5